MGEDTWWDSARFARLPGPLPPASHRLGVDVGAEPRLDPDEAPRMIVWPLVDL